MEFEPLTRSQKAMIKNEREKAEAYDKIRRYCKNCGHTVHVLKERKKIVCSHCFCDVYYDDKEEFKERLQREMRNAKKKK